MSIVKGEWIYGGDTKVSYKITEKQKDEIVERLIKYYSTHLWFGEGIHQDDGSLIEAPLVLSDICDDIIEFKEEDIN